MLATREPRGGEACKPTDIRLTGHFRRLVDSGCCWVLNPNVERIQDAFGSPGSSIFPQPRPSGSWVHFLSPYLIPTWPAFSSRLPWEGLVHSAVCVQPSRTLPNCCRGKGKGVVWPQASEDDIISFLPRCVWRRTPGQSLPHRERKWLHVLRHLPLCLGCALD